MYIITTFTGPTSQPNHCTNKPAAAAVAGLIITLPELLQASAITIGIFPDEKADNLSSPVNYGREKARPLPVAGGQTACRHAPGSAGGAQPPRQGPASECDHPMADPIVFRWTIDRMVSCVR